MDAIDEITDELDAMQTSYTALAPLDEAAQRRALRWLGAKLLGPLDAELGPALGEPIDS